MYHSEKQFSTWESFCGQHSVGLESPQRGALCT